MWTSIAAGVGDLPHFMLFYFYGYVVKLVKSMKLILQKLTKRLSLLFPIVSTLTVAYYI